MTSMLSQKRRHGNCNDFQTPPWALQTLFSCFDIPRGKTIWECAAGNGQLVLALRRRGYKVTASDIKTGTDFLTAEKRGAVIVTNPPYHLKTEFLARAYALAMPFAFLLPVESIAGQARAKLYRRHGISLAIPEARIQFHEGGAHCHLHVAWFCWGLEPRGVYRAGGVFYPVC